MCTPGTGTLTPEELVLAASSPACRKCGHRMVFHQYFTGMSTAVQCQVPTPESQGVGTMRCDCLTDAWNED
jgi:hypothetical protein